MRTRAQKVSIFEHEDLEAITRYCTAAVADMDCRVVIDFFFVAADGRCAEIGHHHRGQRDIVCRHYLWEYPVLISGILSKEKVLIIRYFCSALFDSDRDAKRLHRHDPLQAFSVDKGGPGQFGCFTELCPRWGPDLCPQPGFSHCPCLF